MKEGEREKEKTREKNEKERKHIHTFTRSTDRFPTFTSYLFYSVRFDMIKVPSGTVVVTHLFVKKIVIKKT